MASIVTIRKATELAITQAEEVFEARQNKDNPTEEYEDKTMELGDFIERLQEALSDLNAAWDE